MIRYVLAIDGGATKTALTLRDESGNALYEAESSGSNYQVIGESNCRKVLYSLLKEMQEVHPLTFIDVGVFALAGIDSEKDYETVMHVVTTVLTDLSLEVGELVVENDAFATLVGVTKNQPGVLVIAGTGSIAFAHDGKGHSARSGGWGHRTGDEGSAYWIGMQIVNVIFKMEDGRGPATVLKELVLEELGLGTIHDFTDWIYGEHYSVDAVARLSILLERAVEQRDPVAQTIMKEAVTELTRLTSAVIKSAKLTDQPCTVYFNGGTIKNFGALYAAVKEGVETTHPNKTVTLASESPIESIYQRALVRLNEKK